MSGKPRLKPLKVSWMVSPSVPMLRVSASEDTVEFPTSVEFLATYHDGRESRLRLVFHNGYWLRHTPSYSDKEVVRSDDYDWCDTFLLSAGSDFASSLNRFHQTWEASKACPNPRAYEVHDSPWLKEVGEQDTGSVYRHFLILGHDAYVEVLAKDWHEELVL